MNYIFGPRLPEELDSLGIAFVAAPQMQPDFAVANIKSKRYATENYGYINSNDIYSEGFPSTGFLNISVDYQATTWNNTLATPNQPLPYSGVVPIKKRSWSVSNLNTPIEVKGIYTTPADTWELLIKPGTVWRKYTVTASEPVSSWLRTSGLIDDDTVILIYSVPEKAYTPVYNSSSPIAGSFNVFKEVASVLTPTKIAFSGELDELTSITIDGSIWWSGSFIPNTSVTSSFSFDSVLNTITLNTALNPDSFVEISYKSYSEFYRYSGYRSGNAWYPFNANPEYGNYIGDQDLNALLNSDLALLNQVTIYAYPVAYLKTESFIPNIAATGSIVGTLNLKYYRAGEYGETHFIRHTIAPDRKERIQIRAGAGTLSTWGEAVFGKNFYDEIGLYTTDIFSDYIPSMLPLAKISLTAPVSVKAISVADIRIRGGGIPEDYPSAAVETEASGISTLRSFWDMANWEGQAVKIGGIVSVRIDNSLVKTNEEDNDPNKFMPYEIYDVVKSQMPIGIEFDIEFVDNV